LDSIAADIEQEAFAPLIRKAWLTILQNADNLAAEDIISAIGPRNSLVLARMSPAERFAMYAGQCEFRVNGISATLAKVRDFQKFMALMQMIQANPLMMQAFFAKYSPEKALTHAMRLLNFNPTNMERDPREMAGMGQEFQQLAAFSQLSGNGPASLSGPGTGGEEVPAEVNAMSNPLTGMVG